LESGSDTVQCAQCRRVEGEGLRGQVVPQVLHRSGAGIATFAWPHITLYVVAIFLAWYLIIFGVMHVINALAGPKLAWWWTELLLGIAEFVLGVWAMRSYQRSLLTLVTLVGVWAIFHGVGQIFGSFTLRDVGKRAERAVG
jgi:uncharacterized membrane protein HdeD (DUF308 family)